MVKGHWRKRGFLPPLWIPGPPPGAESVSEAEKRLGRYLTAPEVEFVRQGQSSKSRAFTETERRALKRIWPGMQLEFKLERHSG